MSRSKKGVRGKLDLLMRLLRAQPVSWSGRFRSPVTDQFVPADPGGAHPHLGGGRRKP
jgi:hypothetical protein